MNDNNQPLPDVISNAVVFTEFQSQGIASGQTLEEVFRKGKDVAALLADDHTIDHLRRIIRK